MMASAVYLSNVGEEENDQLFKAIAQNIHDRGYSIHPNALPIDLATQLGEAVQALSRAKFKDAGVGRNSDHTVNQFVRKDKICWINHDTAAGSAWLDWAQALQRYLNRHLFLGLVFFESHFSHYQPGDFYRKHYDAFKGDANRILSVVVYLNHDWSLEDGGELVLFNDQQPLHTTTVVPGFGTIVVFLSEAFPHEVLVTNRDRFAIAGWFRMKNDTVPDIFI